MTGLHREAVLRDGWIQTDEVMAVLSRHPVACKERRNPYLRWIARNMVDHR